jgi:hypothetical protein
LEAHIMQAMRQRRASKHDSKVMSRLIPAIPRSSALRAGVGAAGLLGAAALVAATSQTVIAITVGTTSRLANLDTALSGLDRHGPALLVVAAFALVMLVGALRGARPAMVAVVVCGVVALGIAVLADAPHLDDTGQVGELYTDARAAPGVGFWFEVVGGALLVLAGALLLAGGRARRRSAPVAAAGAARSRTAQ